MLKRKGKTLKNKVLTFIMPVLLAVLLAGGLKLPVRAATEGYKSFYAWEEHRPDSFLGAAQYFGIFARSVRLTTDTETNVAAETFSSSQSFDTGSGSAVTKGHDDNYIQQLERSISANIGNSNTRLFLGAGVDYQPTGAEGEPTITGYKLSTLSADRIYVEDPRNPFLNFDDEFATLATASSQLSELAAKPDIEAEVDEDLRNGNAPFDRNNMVIDVTEVKKDTVIIKLSAKYLSNQGNLRIQGLETTDGHKQVFIVVDSGEADMVDITTHVSLYYAVRKANGQVVQTERSQLNATNFADSTLLWSFVGAGGGKAVAQLHFNVAWSGSVLAPEAVVTNQASFYGSIMAREYQGLGTAFRWDWQGQAPTADSGGGATPTLSVVKFSAADGSQLTGQADPAVTREMTFQVRREADGTLQELNAGNNWSLALEPGAYSIFEANAPQGYATDTTAYPFTVAADGSVADLRNISAAVPSERRDELFADGRGGLIFWKFDAPVETIGDVPLPATGGSGTVWFYLVGSVFILSALGLKRAFALRGGTCYNVNSKGKRL